MASAFETASLVINELRSGSMSAVRLLEHLKLESKGAYVRKVMKALETAGILNTSSGYGRRGKSATRWSLTIEHPSDTMITSALKSMSTSNREPKADKAEGGKLASRVAALEKMLTAGGKVTVEVKVGGAKPVALPEGTVLPAYFQKLVQLASVRKPIMLIGPAGCGKSHVGPIVSKTLGVKFRAISCTAGMSETHLIGRSVPNIADGTSTFQSTDFLDCYENGGVFLLDEIDAADPNLLLVLNSALANGYISVPARSEDAMAYKHRDFVIIASANTFGRGADRVYVGRNQLDESTLDRFRIGTIEVDYDRQVEEALCPCSDLLNVLWQIRDAIQKNGLRRVMSTRFIKDAGEMRQCGWSIREIVDTYFQGWSDNEKSRCMPIIPAEKSQGGDEGVVLESDEKDSGSDGWKLPAMSLSEKQMLGFEVTGVSEKQVEYAERIISKWLRGTSGTSELNAMIEELREAQITRQAKFSNAVIRWFKMNYTPGKGNRPE